MKASSWPRPSLRFLLALTFLSPTAASAAKKDWEPIPAADLAATECVAFPGASAEILDMSHVLENAGNNEWADHYRRIKIYSPKGAAEAGVLQIEYPGTGRAWNAAARVTKPDGRSREFGEKDFTESVAAKIGSEKSKRLTLAVPDLGAGDVLEIRWSQNYTSADFRYFWAYAQLELPVRHYRFAVMGSTRDGKMLWFNSPKVDAKQISKTEIQINFHDLPPFVREPFMPPERDIRSWHLVLHTSPFMRWYSNSDVWKNISNYLEEEFRLLIRPSVTVKSKAAELVQGAADDEEKLKRLYDFCQANISNFNYFTSDELQAAQKALDRREGQNPKETLARGSGYSHHVNELFASLAKAAGFDVTLARSASRYTTMNIQNPNGWLFIDDDLVRVRVGQEWRYYAPGDYYVPAGMLDRSNEMAPSLICDPKAVIFEQNPVSPAARSPIKRKGRFQLDAEGNLEGEVEVAMDGHPGLSRKKSWRNQQQNEIDTEFREEITKRLPGAEVSDLVWENLTGNALPLKVSYKLKVPGYADVAGDKIIVTPNVFEHGRTPIFTSDTRVNPIFFDYAWSENDDIEIALPDGYVLDAANSPTSIGDPGAVLGSRYQIGYKPKSRRLVYKRDFALGGDGSIAFQQASYPKLKSTLDRINRSDEHTVVFKPAPSAADVPVPVATPGA